MIVLQDKDLKQYLDDCGNTIHVHNVKVRRHFFGIGVNDEDLKVVFFHEKL